MENEQMKVMFRQGKLALIDTKNEYVVATDYDWITRKWNKRKGFVHYGNPKKKMEMLEIALTYYMSLLEGGTFITRIRALDLATRFKDVATGADDMSEVMKDLSLKEKEFFFAGEEMESEDWY